MWQQADNDRYHLWRLEHELGLRQIDRLLDSVTASDRPELSNPFALNVAHLAELMDRLLRLLCSRLPSAVIVRRASE